MKIGFEVFLVVAREMSITKAANELHITQQCASDHIKRLEKEYNVVLFERRPKFRLTQAGEIMLHNLLNIQIMETSMSRSLAGIAEGTVGGFTLGISTSRAPIILPRVLPRYYQCYPKVNISFTEEDTQILEEREFTEQEIRQMEDGIDLKRFSNIPFTQSFKTGKVNHAIQEYLDSYNVKLNVIYNISDSETQILLCASGICAALCPKMLLAAAYRHNQTCKPEDELYMFPIRNLGRELKIELVSHRNAMHPMYIQDFVHILQEELPRIADSMSLEELRKSIQ